MSGGYGSKSSNTGSPGQSGSFGAAPASMANMAIGGYQGPNFFSGIANNAPGGAYTPPNQVAQTQQSQMQSQQAGPNQGGLSAPPAYSPYNMNMATPEFNAPFLAKEQQQAMDAQTAMFTGQQPGMGAMEMTPDFEAYQNFFKARYNPATGSDQLPGQWEAMTPEQKASYNQSQLPGGNATARDPLFAGMPDDMYNNMMEFNKRTGPSGFITMDVKPWDRWMGEQRQQQQQDPGFQNFLMEPPPPAPPVGQPEGIPMPIDRTPAPPPAPVIQPPVPTPVAKPAAKPAAKLPALAPRAAPGPAPRPVARPSPFKPVAKPVAKPVFRPAPKSPVRPVTTRPGVQPALRTALKPPTR